jgi:hypothetical protein
MTTNYRHQNRQAQRTLTNRKHQKIKNKKQSLTKVTQIQINTTFQQSNQQVLPARRKSPNTIKINNKKIKTLCHSITVLII